MSSDHHKPETPKIFSATAPSTTFERAWTHSGALTSAECEACGRTYFLGRGTRHGDFEPGELEDLEAKALAHPDRFIEITTYDSIDVGRLADKQVVVGCACNVLRQYEDFLWTHRYQVAEFLRAKLKEVKADAEAKAATAASLREKVPAGIDFMVADYSGPRETCLAHLQPEPCVECASLKAAGL